MVVTVHDGVFTASACRYLHTALSLGGIGDEHHTVFRRAAPPRTALETCLHSVLSELGDHSPHVEYWWRDSYENIAAHADLDEYYFERAGAERYPTHAHVLYLSIGERVQVVRSTQPHPNLSRDPCPVS